MFLNKLENHPGFVSDIATTCVKQVFVDHVARQLNKSRGSAYAARSRVMRRLKEKVQELQMIDLERENQDD